MTVHAVVVGPSVDNTYNQTDSLGQRLNIDQNVPFVLAPGTYIATDFTFFATGASALTTPFLVINSDAAVPNPSGDIDSYRIIASGTTRSVAPVAGTNTVQTVPFGGDFSFTLTATTKVFAGVASGSADQSQGNAIGWKTGGVVDHHNPQMTQFTPTVGGTIPTFTNPDLARTYGFNITVIPEPASAALLTMGGMLLLARRRQS